MDRHELGNMIFNLEDKKNLKEVKFTKDAVREVLGYLKELYEIKDKEHEEDIRVANLEAELAESEKLNKRLQQVIDKLRDKEFAGETLVNAVNAVYEPLYQNKYDEAEQLKQQLAEKDQAIESLQEINQSLGQTCNNDAKEIERLREQLADKEKEIEWYKEVQRDWHKSDTVTQKIFNQTAIAVLEEMLDNEVYINSKLDFEDGNYVLSKIIRTKIEELKNGRK